jgi:hypothetical protein
VPAAFAIDAVDVPRGVAVARDRSRLPGHEEAAGPLTVADVGPAGEALFERRRVLFQVGTGGFNRRDFYIIQPHSAARYLMQLQHRGNVEGYEMLRRETTVRWVGDPEYCGEAYLQHGLGSARLVEFSPSRFVVEVDARAPDVLLLNQTVYGGWYATVDGRTERVDVSRPLVSVDVPAGQHRVVFWFRPDGFWVGLAVSAGSLVAVPVCILIRRRMPRNPASHHTR